MVAAADLTKNAGQRGSETWGGWRGGGSRHVEEEGKGSLNSNLGHALD